MRLILACGCSSLFLFAVLAGNKDGAVGEAAVDVTEPTVLVEVIEADVLETEDYTSVYVTVEPEPTAKRVVTDRPLGPVGHVPPDMETSVSFFPSEYD